MRTVRAGGLLAVVALLVVSWLVARDRSAAPPPTDPGPPSGSSSSSALGRAEARGGHTLRRHVGKSDDELRRRLAREPGISAASTFTDRATADRTVAAVLAEEGDRIERWLAGRAATLALDYRSPAGPLGRSLARGETIPVASSEARVVLARAEWSFFVLTAYPLQPR